MNCVCSKCVCALPVFCSRDGESSHRTSIVSLCHQQTRHCIRAAEVHQMSSSTKCCRLEKEHNRNESIYLFNTKPTVLEVLYINVLASLVKSKRTNVVISLTPFKTLANSHYVDPAFVTEL